MLNENRTEFTALLATAMAVYGKTITTGMVDLYFSALQRYELDVVREGLNRHLQDPQAGQFAPKPADVIRQIQESHHDGRPEGDEAWSMAILASDEQITTVLTEEIQGALWAARPLLEMGDKIAARKAFLDSYARLVRIAREKGKPAAWHVSLGLSKSGRAEAIDTAVRLGRISHDSGSRYLAEIGFDSAPLTQDGQAIAGLLTGKPIPAGASQAVREKLAALRSVLTTGMVQASTSSKAFDRAERAKRNAIADRVLGIGDGVQAKNQEDAK